MNRESLTGSERTELLEELYKKYGKGSSGNQKRLYLRKKYFWLFTTVGALALKRLIDIVISLTTLIITLPLWLIIALCIKLHDAGNVFFISQRVGKWGKEFTLLKFRSMILHAENVKKDLLKQNKHQSDIKFKMKEDPRVTWIGRFIRKFSLDELPQLINVLKGEMSLVGPRPPLASEVANYTIAQRQRLDIKPGLTCIWQINGRSEIPFNEQVNLDLEYIESRSFWMDLVILVKTIPAVFFGRGAY
jgi:lipopolysaccharide/colanic/teichoic acid biosynthesis glycosyltransferase